MKILLWNRNRALGDGIIHSGLIRELRLKYPHAQIDIFCTQMHAAALQGNIYLNNIYLFNHYVPLFRTIKQQKIVCNSLFHLPNLLKARKQCYDIIFDVSSLYQRDNLTMLKILKTKNTNIVGLFNPKNPQKYTKEYLLKYYTTLDEHNIFSIVDINITPKYDFFIPDDKLQKAIEFYKKNVPVNNKVIIFNGDGSGNKSLAKEKIIESVKILAEDSNLSIFFLGHDAVKNKYESIIQIVNKPNVQLTYSTNIFDAGALIKHADLLISVDTALIHIADAVNAPVLEICGTSTKSYSPLTPPHTKFLTVNQKCSNPTGFETNKYDSTELYQKAITLIYGN